MSTTIVRQHGTALHVAADEMSALKWVQRYQPQSFDYAQKHMGITLEQPEPWPFDKARELSSIARGMFSRHDHNMSDRDPMTRENCGACVLNGYTPRSGWGDDIQGPNYAGWARAYVQAGKPVPAKWASAFLAELNSDNRAYADALARDLATFGLNQ